jgi:SAM-dependent methyltransferase
VDTKQKPTQQYVFEWARNAERDPLWVILSDPAKRGGKWELEEFLGTGEVEVESLMAWMKASAIEVDVNGCFMDFGCGVGRVSRALRQRFASGAGIDISSRMVERARDLCPTVEYRVNQTSDLADYSSDRFSFVYCHIVLQHMNAWIQERFLKEFMRVLKPGGIAAIQVPIGIAGKATEGERSVLGRLAALLPKATASRIRAMLGRDIVIEMHTVPAASVRRLVAEAGCEVVAEPYTNSTDMAFNGRLKFYDRDQALERIARGETASHYLSQFFFIRKPSPAAEVAVADGPNRQDA